MLRAWVKLVRFGEKGSGVCVKRLAGLRESDIV